MNEKRDETTATTGPQGQARHESTEARRQEEAESAAPKSDAASGDGGAAAGEPDVRAQIIEKLHTVFDPEIPVDIYELGLIYEIDVKPSGDVHITMTLTSPACPSAQELPAAVRGAASVVPAVKDVEVDVVFDPPWSPEKMSEEARVALGMM